MNKRIGFFLFAVFFTLCVFLHYQDWLQPDKSLYLAVFRGDPAPRFSFYPWLIESAKQFSRGHFPLWCDREGLGMPLLANYQSTPFNPFNLVFEIFPDLKLLDWLLLLKLFLLGIFTWGFAAELGLSAMAAAGSAVIICFSGYVSETINQVNFNTELWLPAGLLLAEKILKNRADLLKFVLLGLVASMAMLGGNPEAAFYFLLFILLYALVRGGRKKARELLVICLAFGFGVILSSAQLLSFIEYLGFGWHIHTNYLYTIGRPPLKWLFSLFFPWIFGLNRTHPEQLFMLSYLGLIPVFLALFTLVKTPSLPRPAIFFWAYILVFLALIYRIPPADFLGRLPIMNRIASTKFAYFGVCFSLAMLAGFGLEYFRKKELSSREFAIALGIISGLAIGAALLAHRSPVGPVMIRDAWLYPMILFLIAAVIALYGIFFEERKLAGALLVFLSLINLLHLYPGLVPEARVSPENWRFRAPAVPQYLMPIIEDRGARFTGINGAFHQNLNLIYRLNDLRVFEGIYPRDYVRLIGEIEGFTMDQAVEAFFAQGWSFEVQPKNLDHPMIGRMGVKYLLTPDLVSIPEWDRSGSKIGGFYLYRNRQARGRVSFQGPEGEPVLGWSQIVQSKPDQVEVAVKTEGPAELVLSDQYAPGWRAFSWPDQTELRIEKEAGLFRKAPIKNGDSMVDFSYQPRGFQIGLFFSLASWAAALLALAAHQVRKRFARA